MIFLCSCLCKLCNVECFLVMSRMFDVFWLIWCINFKKCVCGCNARKVLIMLKFKLFLLCMVMLEGLLIINIILFLYKIWFFNFVILLSLVEMGILFFFVICIGGICMILFF